MRFAAGFGAISLLLALAAAPAQADVIILDFNDDFDGTGNGTGNGTVNANHPLVNDPPFTNHGFVVTTTTGFNQTTGTAGTIQVGITADDPPPDSPNENDLAVIFDTRLPNTADPDLEDPLGAANAEGEDGFLAYPITPASGGFGAARRPGHVLIRNNNDTGCGDGVCNNPNDDGSGTVFNVDFSNFDGGVSLLTIDILDLDDESASDELLTLAIFDEETGDQIGSDVEIVGADIGDRNVARLDLQHFFDGNAGVGRMQIELSSSGAWTNLAFSTTMSPPTQVPEPGSLALLAAGLAGLGLVHRRRRKAEG